MTVASYNFLVKVYGVLWRQKNAWGKSEDVPYATQVRINRMQSELIKHLVNVVDFTGDLDSKKASAIVKEADFSQYYYRLESQLRNAYYAMEKFNKIRIGAYEPRFLFTWGNTSWYAWATNKFIPIEVQTSDMSPTNIEEHLRTVISISGQTKGSIIALRGLETMKQVLEEIIANLRNSFVNFMETSSRAAEISWQGRIADDRILQSEELKRQIAGAERMMITF